MKFTHLHVHSHYSLLQALPKIPELIEIAKKEEMEALALTDNGNMYGAIEFYKECKKSGIEPIIGVDAYLANRTRFDKQAGIDKDRFRLVLLCKNEIGYKNLLKLVTASYLEGFYYKPRIDFELLEKYSEGIIAISSSWNGDISTALRNKNVELAEELIQKYKNIFAENFFLEITMHPEFKGHNEQMNYLAEFAKKKELPIVACHDIYYIAPEDKEARDTLLAIQHGAPNNQKDRGVWDDENEDFSFLSGIEMKERFKDMPEAIFNNHKITALCNLELKLGRWSFPDIKIESGKSYDQELRSLAYEGLKRRGLPKSEDVIKRLEYELDIIKTKGYSSYFLVVADLMSYAREHGILTNIRGSVSGSLVTYTSGITNINPLEYAIPFERFLNPDRPSAPDIDMDFADDRRDEMVEYVKRKYGEDKVAQIGTFGTMMARGSVRDTARALGFAYNIGDRIAKLIPMGQQGFPMTIDRAINEVPELAELYKKDKDTKKIIDMAKKIEGCARHIGVHAAGVVISPKNLTDFTPLQYDPKGEARPHDAVGRGKIITQYDMYSVDENGAGLLKFDFLGLKNLSIIAATIVLVKRTKDVKIDLDTMPIDDNKTFKMLARGETEDLFQLNGDGMTRFLVELKPTSIHDINAMVALYRPGPMQFIPNYIERKHDSKKITYLDTALKPILEKTYGILIYQDDLLIMAHDLAGYTWGEVDKFRKAVGKKIQREMQEQKEKFIRGCMEYSKWTEKKAKEIWGWIEPFAAYGFNKAHSVSYGRVAYQTAYLKANFPREYMTSVLSAESGDVEKVARSIAECKRMGIKILPPDINESFSDFTLVEGKETIRFGLTTIKNFGEGIAHSITSERKKNGKFKSLEDFLVRIQDKNLNKKSLEALIKSGAMDIFGDRGILLASMDMLLEYNKESVGNKEQDSLFSFLAASGNYSPLHLVPANPVTPAEKLSWEKELLGLYISGHPLEQFKEKLLNQKTTIKKIKESSKENDLAVVGGLIENIRSILTKSGDKMFFIKFVDLTDEIELVVFPRILQEFPNIFVPDQCIVVKARVSSRNGEKSLIAEKAKKL